MNNNTIIDMKTSQFPFGEVEDQEYESKKILIKKRVLYKNEKQHLALQQKINILKNIYHKNIINFRFLDDDQNGTIDIYYNYVPFSIQQFFSQCDAETIKQIHKQLIQLVIHLAKNCILTSFNPSRCGVLMNADNKWQIKYYLPLYEILVTSDVAMLERSVQIFTVQALHYLDLLSEGIQEGESSFEKHGKGMDMRYRDSTGYTNKSKWQSQIIRESKMGQSLNKRPRRQSNQPTLHGLSRRKFSNFSIRKSQYSLDSYKNGNASTLFQTMRSSNPTIDLIPIRQDQSLVQLMKPLSIIQRAQQSCQRSRQALEVFGQIIQSMKLVEQVNQIVKEMRE